MGVGISNKDDASLWCTAPKWRPCNAHMVPRKNFQVDCWKPVLLLTVFTLHFLQWPR